MRMSMCTEAGCRGPRGGADHMSQLLLFSARWNLPIRSWFIMVCSGLFSIIQIFFKLFVLFFLGWTLPARKLPFLSSICRVLRALRAGCGSNWQPPHSLLPGGSLGAGLSQELDPESLGVLAARPFRNPSNEVLIYLIYWYSYHKSEFY